MLSGSATDAQFASGLLSTLKEADGWIPETIHTYWRPVATLPAPLGRIIGDVGFIRRAPSGEATLVIVEREVSAPGNERNLLKWYEAVRQHLPIALRSKTVQQNVTVDRTYLLLMFARPAGWDVTGFQKTVAFCSILAELINSHALQSGVPLQIEVASYPGMVTDWMLCGQHCATRLMTWFGEASSL